MAARAIDWAEAHRRQAIAEALVAGESASTPEDVRRILAARAKAAARPVAGPDLRHRLEVLVFSLAGETYGVEIGCVHEVCQLKDLTPLPCTPPFIAGVMNLRGRIVAVVNLRSLFDLPSAGLTELNRVVVIGEGNDEFGLLADSVAGVQSIVASEMQEGLPTLTGIREKYLKGVTARRLVVLDGGALLRDADLKVNEHLAR